MRVTTNTTAPVSPGRPATRPEPVDPAGPGATSTADHLEIRHRPPADESPQALIRKVREATERPPYQSPEMPALDAARSWQPGSAALSGTQANRTINETYHALSAAFDRYLGEPSLPNWMTFGQYASREAGTQIDSLEDAFTALHAVNHSHNPVEIYRALDEAMGHLSPEMAEQVLKLAWSQFEEPTTAETLLLGVLPGLGAAKQVVDLLSNTMGAVERLHKALVKGNVGIYSNMAPAYDAFLRAESRGQDGLEALRLQGYQPGGPRDPQGFLTEAFTRYQQARELGHAALTAPPSQREQLLAERQKLVHEANLLIGIQEQMVILQAPGIYGDAEVARVVDAQGELSLTDPRGTHRLVGNWSDFATRMGLEAVPRGTPGAIAIRDHQGRTNTYRVPTPPKPGTISAYFADGLEPRVARTLLAGSPRPI